MTTNLDRLTAAHRAQADLGVTLADLQDSEPQTRVPTFGEYLPTVIATAAWTRSAPPTSKA